MEASERVPFLCLLWCVLWKKLRFRMRRFTIFEHFHFDAPGLGGVISPSITDPLLALPTKRNSSSWLLLGFCLVIASPGYWRHTLSLAVVVSLGWQAGWLCGWPPIRWISPLLVTLASQFFSNCIRQVATADDDGALARISVVDGRCNVLLDRLVAPDAPPIDLRTHITGITETRPG